MPDEIIPPGAVAEMLARCEALHARRTMRGSTGHEWCRFCGEPPDRPHTWSCTYTGTREIPALCASHEALRGAFLHEQEERQWYQNGWVTLGEEGERVRVVLRVGLKAHRPYDTPTTDDPSDWAKVAVAKMVAQAQRIEALEAGLLDVEQGMREAVEFGRSQMIANSAYQALWSAAARKARALLAATPTPDEEPTCEFLYGNAEECGQPLEDGRCPLEGVAHPPYPDARPGCPHGATPGYCPCPLPTLPDAGADAAEVG